MPLANYFHLLRWEPNDHTRFGALFVTFTKLQIIVFTILSLFTKSEHNFWDRFDGFILYILKM